MTSANRVKESTTSTSTSTISLAGASPGFRAFAAKFTNGTTINDVMIGPDSAGAWLIGDYTISGSTLTRVAISDSSSDGADVTLAAGSKDVFATASAQTIIGKRDVAFSTSVPLDFAGETYMPRTKVTAGMTLTVAAGAVRGALAYLRLLGDGSTVPTFNGMLQWGGSLDFDPRLNIENQVQVFSDGTSVFYSITQAANAQPIPVAATTILLSGPTTGVVNTASSNFTVSADGTLANPVAVTPSAGAGGGMFSPASVTLTSGQSATFTYTPTSTGAKTISVTNNGGLVNPVAITYTVTAAAALRFSPLTRVAESGTGPYTYTGSGASTGFGTNEGDAVLTLKFPQNADGVVAEMVIKVLNTPTSGSGSTNELVVGISPSGTADKKYTDLWYGIVGHAASYDNFAGTNYAVGNSGIGAAANDYIKFQISGSTLTASVSKNSGQSYTVVKSWSGVALNSYFFHVLVTGVGSWTPISSSGLV